MVVSVAILAAADLLKLRGIAIRNRIAAAPMPVRWLIISASITAILIFGIWGAGYDAAGFIYFQF